MDLSKCLENGITSLMLSFDLKFKRSAIDYCLYTIRANDNSLILLALYVDDIMLASKTLMS